MTEANKNILTTSLAVLILVVLVGAGIYYSQKQSQQTVSQNNNQTSNSSGQAQGRVVFGITDAAANMSGISSVWITVTGAKLHSQTAGWVTVSNATRQYDLLALKQNGTVSLIADANVDAGTYDQARFMVSKVVVVKNRVQQEAKLPSGDLKFFGKVVVNADHQATIVFDFMTDKSIHMTGNGKLIFTPVIQLESHSDVDASVDEHGEIHINNAGKLEDRENEGMDIDGEMKANFELDANTKLDEVNDVLKVTVDGENDHAIKVTAASAISTAVSGGYLDSAISVTLVDRKITSIGEKDWLVSGLKNLVLTNVYVNAMTGAVVSSSTQGNVTTEENSKWQGTVSNLNSPTIYSESFTLTVTMPTPASYTIHFTNNAQGNYGTNSLPYLKNGDTAIVYGTVSGSVITASSVHDITSSGM